MEIAVVGAVVRISADTLVAGKQTVAGYIAVVGN